MEFVESVRLPTGLQNFGWHASLRDQTRFSPEDAFPALTDGAIGFMDFFSPESHQC